MSEKLKQHLWDAAMRCRKCRRHWDDVGELECQSRKERMGRTMIHGIRRVGDSEDHKPERNGR